MPVLAAFALANLKHDLGALWAWLCHRSFWQLTTMAACIYIGVQYFQLADARHDRDAYMNQRDGYKRTLEKLSAQSKSQQKEVTKVVDHYVTVTKPEIVERVRKIESAPLPGNCSTPKEILDADI